jgi:hypothetical protein
MSIEMRKKAKKNFFFAFFRKKIERSKRVKFFIQKKNSKKDVFNFKKGKAVFLFLKLRIKKRKWKFEKFKNKTFPSIQIFL